MKLYPPIYPGESLFHPGTFPGGDIKSIWPAAIFGTGFVRSKSNVPARPDIRFDPLAIEQQARFARNEWIASRLKFYYAAIRHKLERPGAVA